MSLHDHVSSLFSLEGQVAVVTGASSGLGYRFAKVLHAAGATVVAAARREERLNQLASECGDGLIPVVTDVANDDDCVQLINIAADAGPLEILVNNAGIGDQFTAEDEDPAHFRQVLEVNLTAPFVLSQLAARRMLPQRSGSIINVASVLGLVASAPIKQASYCASKGGLVNLTRELGAQWARKGVRVNALAPGWFVSEMTDVMWGDEGSMNFIQRNTPMGRGGNEDELDGALLFLASRASTYVTGQILAVDGGWTAR